MSIKKLRQKKNLSQEELADTTGLSLRTIQRVESGNSVSTASWKTLASFFGMSVEALQETNQVMDLGSQHSLTQQRLAYHRSAQLIIFIVVFFVAVSQWLAYYASLSPGNSSASLWTI
ncbi:MAG: helix-turn-helix domain-containing protein, partial [Proteobacteria bacterium]|nr:helix-turn-helix domain-containing protein [Pseudomonadota bacterium]